LSVHNEGLIDEACLN